MNKNDKTESHVMLSINKLMGLFHDTLLSIADPLEQASISWDSYEDYEEIETISESLFNLIVKYQLENYVKTKYSKELNIPQYGFYHKNYKGYDAIEVKTIDSEDKYVFVLFESKNGRFDTVMCDKIDEEGNIISRENEFLFDEVDFVRKINTK